MAQYVYVVIDGRIYQRVDYSDTCRTYWRIKTSGARVSVSHRHYRMRARIDLTAAGTLNRLNQYNIPVGYHTDLDALYHATGADR